MMYVNIHLGYVDNGEKEQKNKKNVEMIYFILLWEYGNILHKIFFLSLPTGEQIDCIHVYCFISILYVLKFWVFLQLLFYMVSYCGLAKGKTKMIYTL